MYMYRVPRNTDVTCLSRPARSEMDRQMDSHRDVIPIGQSTHAGNTKNMLTVVFLEVVQFIFVLSYSLHFHTVLD